MSKDKTLKKFHSYVNLLTDIISIESLLDWDTETSGMPEEGLAPRESQKTTLEEIYQEKLKAKKMKNYLKKLKDDSFYKKLSRKDKALVDYWNKEYEEATKIPNKVARAHAKLFASSSHIWARARTSNKYIEFAPTLEKIIKAKRKEAKYLSKDQPYYDVLLNQFEPGFTMNKLDILFCDLRAEIVPLLKDIKASTVPNKDYAFLSRTIDGETFKEFLNKIMTNMGFDYNRGKLATSAHPFSSGIASPYDVRITTQEIKKKLKVSEALDHLGTAMHEAGHAIFEQNAGPEIEYTGLQGGTLGIHESQSRLWEVMVGKSKAFWRYYFPLLQKTFPQTFEDIDLEDFYRAYNHVSPGFIRIHADEVTYNLHIILRYEIEKEMILTQDTKAFVTALPKMWNAKMKEYLDIRPTTNAKGLLQDIHWSLGAVGYFPSYTLGNIASVQFMEQAKKEIPELEKHIEKGNLLILKNWLSDKIYKDGQIDKPEEILKRVTGEPLNAKYYVEYLKNKYKELYVL
jgi:carboxypeptidase Taq